MKLRYFTQSFARSLREAVEHWRKENEQQEKYVMAAICSEHCV